MKIKGYVAHMISMVLQLKLLIIFIIIS